MNLVLMQPLEGIQTLVCHLHQFLLLQTPPLLLQAQGGEGEALQIIMDKMNNCLNRKGQEEVNFNLSVPPHHEKLYLFPTRTQQQH